MAEELQDQQNCSNNCNNNNKDDTGDFGTKTETVKRPEEDKFQTENNNCNEPGVSSSSKDEKTSETHELHITVTPSGLVDANSSSVDAPGMDAFVGGVKIDILYDGTIKNLCINIPPVTADTVTKVPNPFSFTRGNSRTQQTSMIQQPYVRPSSPNKVKFDIPQSTRLEPDEVSDSSSTSSYGATGSNAGSSIDTSRTSYLYSTVRSTSPSQSSPPLLTNTGAPTSTNYPHQSAVPSGGILKNKPCNIGDSSLNEEITNIGSLTEIEFEPEATGISLSSDVDHLASSVNKSLDSVIPVPVCGTSSRTIEKCNKYSNNSSPPATVFPVKSWDCGTENTLVKQRIPTPGGINIPDNGYPGRSSWSRSILGLGGNTGVNHSAFDNESATNFNANQQLRRVALEGNGVQFWKRPLGGLSSYRVPLSESPSREASLLKPGSFTTSRVKKLGSILEYSRSMFFDVCDFCGSCCLDPYDNNKRQQHISRCIQELQRDIDLTDAITKSQHKECGICLETIMKKSVGHRLFAILPNCNHCYCVECVKKYTKEYKPQGREITCPECRTPFNSYCPSTYWVESTEEKLQLFTNYGRNTPKLERKGAIDEWLLFHLDD